MISVAVIDDHAMVRDALVRAVNEQPDMVVCASGADPAVALGATPAPTVVLLDLDLGARQAGPADAEALLQHGSAVLVVSALHDHTLARSLIDVGVAGVCPKHEPVESLLEAIRAVAAGDTWTSPLVAQILLADPRPDRPALSSQELRVLRDYAAGMPLTAVAAKLFITPDTAAQYIKRIRRKYDDVGRDTHTKAALYQQAVRDGYIEPPT